MNQVIPKFYSENRPLFSSNPPILEVYDNLFPSYILDNIENLSYTSQFIYHQELTDQKTTLNSKNIGFSRSLFSYENKYFADVIGETVFPFLEPLYFFTTQNKLSIKNILNARLFLQPPSLFPGPQPIHLDSFHSHMVFLYYVNDSDGDTYFYNDSGEVIKQVSPKKGRVAWFDGSYYHCGSRPKTSSRIVLNIDLILNK